MPSCGTPYPDNAFTVRRSSSVGSNRMPVVIDYLFQPRRRYIREAPTSGLQQRLLARKRLPAEHGHIDVGRRQLDGVAAAPGHLGGDDRRAGSAERFVYG